VRSLSLIFAEIAINRRESKAATIEEGDSRFTSDNLVLYARPLEVGRTTLRPRCLVNSGPGVRISPSAPNLISASAAECRSRPEHLQYGLQYDGGLQLHACALSCCSPR